MVNVFITDTYPISPDRLRESHITLHSTAVATAIRSTVEDNEGILHTAAF